MFLSLVKVHRKRCLVTLLQQNLKMNIACSTCLEPFTSISDISSTPCGHVFHTNCIIAWLKNGRKSCSQCQRNLHEDQIIKLYLSEGNSESRELRSEILRLNNYLYDLKKNFGEIEKNFLEEHKQ